MRVQTLSSTKILPIRQAVLRPGKSLKDCFFEGDENPESFHLGAFEKEILTGCVSLMNQKNPAFQENLQFQLRGMAVLPEFRNQKIGAKLLRAAEKKLRAQKTEILWCNARKAAVGFYKKYGFEVFGEEFHIPEIGLHRSMFKKL